MLFILPHSCCVLCCFHQVTIPQCSYTFFSLSPPFFSLLVFPKSYPARTNEYRLWADYWTAGYHQKYFRQKTRGMYTKSEHNLCGFKGLRPNHTWWTVAMGCVQTTDQCVWYHDTQVFFPVKVVLRWIWAKNWPSSPWTSLKWKISLKSGVFSVYHYAANTRIICCGLNLFLV